MIARLLACAICVLPGACAFAQSEPTALACRILRLEPDFFPRHDVTNPNDGAYVLNDLETFFLFKFPRGQKCTPVQFRSGESVALSDTYGSGQPCNFICVTVNIVDETWRMRLCTPSTSNLQLAVPVNVDVPSNGSAIVQMSNPLEDGRLTYVWIIAADSYP